MRAARVEAGFALPLTLFLVALVTLILSAALVQVDVDRRIAESAADEVDVVALARSGLQTLLATTNFDGCDRPLRPADRDSTRINVTGGYADVVAYVVRRPMPDSLAPWTYVVRSTGQLIEPALGADPRAVHTVGQYALWSSGGIDVLGAYVAANGLNRDAGGNGQLHGSDETGSCPRPSVPSLRVSGSLPSLLDYDLTGLSPVSGGSQATVAAATNIDWAKTLGGGVVPDYTSVRVFDYTYPVMVVQGNATLGTPGGLTAGTGLLIVGGNLRVIGDWVQWYGVVLVGGKIDFDADDQRFDGIVVSGLNAQLGISVTTGRFGGDYLDIDYNSGYLRQALKSLAGFGQVTNAWVENWATY